MAKEVWKNLLEYPKYQISTFGRVKSLKKEPYKILKPRKRGDYLSVNLYNPSKPVKTENIHVLVAKAFLGYQPCKDLVCDHIDNNPKNNKLENLQIVTIRENCSKDKKNNTSDHTGVFWHKASGKWSANIFINGGQFYLGCFDTEEKAHQYYLNALNNYKKGIPIKRNKKGVGNYKNISWNNSRKKWIAKIYRGGKTKHIGSFDNELQAKKELDNFLNKQYGFNG